jgi:hypothetical protein
MTKSFVLYTILEVEGKLVDCIYFANNQCRAQPVIVGVSTMGESYKPTEADKRKYCQNEAEFKACPRFTAYQNHLKAVGLER